jgi:hypothetical protein
MHRAVDYYRHTYLSTAFARWEKLRLARLHQRMQLWTSSRMRQRLLRYRLRQWKQSANSSRTRRLRYQELWDDSIPPHESSKTHTTRRFHVEHRALQLLRASRTFTRLKVWIATRRRVRVAITKKSTIESWKLFSRMSAARFHALGEDIHLLRMRSLWQTMIKIAHQNRGVRMITGKRNRNMAATVYSRWRRTTQQQLKSKALLRRFIRRNLLSNLRLAFLLWRVKLTHPAAKLKRQLLLTDILRRWHHSYRATTHCHRRRLTRSFARWKQTVISQAASTNILLRRRALLMRIVVRYRQRMTAQLRSAFDAWKGQASNDGGLHSSMSVLAQSISAARRQPASRLNNSKKEPAAEELAARFSQHRQRNPSPMGSRYSQSVQPPRTNTPFISPNPRIRFSPSPWPQSMGRKLLFADLQSN